MFVLATAAATVHVLVAFTAAALDTDQAWNTLLVVTATVLGAIAALLTVGATTVAGVLAAGGAAASHLSVFGQPMIAKATANITADIQAVRSPASS